MRIETDQAEYGSGSQVVVRFTNASAELVSYNGCFGFLERAGAVAWSSVAPASDVPCRDYVAGLPPGASATSSFTLPATLSPGVYRYRFTRISAPSENLLAEAERVTNSFTVIVRD
ncbi:MAG: hypothetical protein ACRET3_12255 [Burkholderiales bacterium]